MSHLAPRLLRLDGQATVPSIALPSLYCTRTILQPSRCYHVRRDLREAVDSSDNTRSPRLSRSLRTSSATTSQSDLMSHRERRTFEKLLKSTGNDSSKKNSKAKPRKSLVKKQIPLHEWPISLQNLAHKHQSNLFSGSRAQASELSDKNTADGIAEDKLQIQLRQVFREAEEHILSAKTDLEIWQTLEKELFAIVKDLDLDGSSEDGGLSKPEENGKGEKSKPRSSKPKSSGIRRHKDSVKSRSLHVLRQSYPNLILLAMRQLREHFPASAMPLSLLPTMKSLGRSSHMLGASTAFYNELIVYMWSTYSAEGEVAELLREMENGGIEFDGDTLHAVNSILEEMKDLRKGRYGARVAEIFKVQKPKKASNVLTEWRNVIRNRLESEAILAARESHRGDREGADFPLHLEPA